MKLLANGFRLKISRMVGSNIQRFAGGPRPLGKKRSQEQCQGHKGNIWMETVASPSKQVLQSQG